MFKTKLAKLVCVLEILVMQSNIDAGPLICCSKLTSSTSTCPEDNEGLAFNPGPFPMALYKVFYKLIQTKGVRKLCLFFYFCMYVHGVRHSNKRGCRYAASLIFYIFNHHFTSIKKIFGQNWATIAPKIVFNFTYYKRKITLQLENPGIDHL